MQLLLTEANNTAAELRARIEETTLLQQQQQFQQMQIATQNAEQYAYFQQHSAEIKQWIDNQSSSDAAKGSSNNNSIGDKLSTIGMRLSPQLTRLKHASTGIFNTRPDRTH